MSSPPSGDSPPERDVQFEIASLRMRLTMHQVFLTAVTGWLVCSTLQLTMATGLFGLAMLGSGIFVLWRNPDVYQLLGTVRLATLERRVTWMVLGVVVAGIGLHFAARALVGETWTAAADATQLSLAGRVATAVLGAALILFIFARFLPAHRLARRLCLVGFAIFAAGLLSLHLEHAATGTFVYYIALDGMLAWICPGCAVRFGAYSTNLGGVFRHVGAVLYIIGLSSWLGSLRRRSDKAICAVLGVQPPQR